MAVVAAPLPPRPLFARLREAARASLVLLLLMWLPLVAYVMFRRPARRPADYVLLPAIPAALLLYALAVWSWRESMVAVVGVTLVFFWVILAVTAPYLPLARSEQAGRAVRHAVHREERRLLLARHRHARPRHALAHHLGLPARARLGHHGDGRSPTSSARCSGSIAGYLGGWWDQIVSFFANVLLSFPVMVLFILILNYLGPSGFNIVIAVTFSSAPQIMRIVRGLALDVKSRDYIFAAQTRGESPLRIMVVELLPNVRGPLIVDACLRLGYTTVAITTLTFLGLGLQPPDPDWGLMIKEASTTALVWKFSYMLLIPALSVSSLILGFNLMADGLREMSMRD